MGNKNKHYKSKDKKTYSKHNTYFLDTNGMIVALYNDLNLQIQLKDKGFLTVNSNEYRATAKNLDEEFDKIKEMDFDTNIFKISYEYLHNNVLKLAGLIREIKAFFLLPIILQPFIKIIDFTQETTKFSESDKKNYYTAYFELYFFCGIANLHTGSKEQARIEFEKVLSIDEIMYFSNTKISDNESNNLLISPSCAILTTVVGQEPANDTEKLYNQQRAALKAITHCSLAQYYMDVNSSDKAYDHMLDSFKFAILSKEPLFELAEHCEKLINKLMYEKKFYQAINLVKINVDYNSTQLVNAFKCDETSKKQSRKNLIDAKIAFLNSLRRNNFKIIIEMLSDLAKTSFLSFYDDDPKNKKNNENSEQAIVPASGKAILGLVSNPTEIQFKIILNIKFRWVHQRFLKNKNFEFIYDKDSNKFVLTNVADKNPNTVKYVIQQIYFIEQRILQTEAVRYCENVPFFAPWPISTQQINFQITDQFNANTPSLDFFGKGINEVFTSDRFNMNLDKNQIDTAILNNTVTWFNGRISLTSSHIQATRSRNTESNIYKFYFQENAVSDQLEKKRKLNLLEVFQLAAIEPKICAASGEQGLKRLKQPIKGMVTIDNHELEVEFIWELKILGTGKEPRILCYELPSDNFEHILIVASNYEEKMHSQPLPNYIRGPVLNSEDLRMSDIQQNEIIKNCNNTVVETISNYKISSV